MSYIKKKNGPSCHYDLGINKILKHSAWTSNPAWLGVVELVHRLLLTPDLCKESYSVLSLLQYLLSLLSVLLHIIVKNLFQMPPLNLSSKGINLTELLVKFNLVLCFPYSFFHLPYLHIYPPGILDKLEFGCSELESKGMGGCFYFCFFFSVLLCSY